MCRPACETERPRSTSIPILLPHASCASLNHPLLEYLFKFTSFQALECSVLDLTDCGLRPQDAQALAACFPANTICTSVLLDNNRLGDAGFSAILHALAENPRITALSSAYNGITGRCAEALKLFGEKNNKCKALCLRGNRLGDSGIKSLADAIASNNSCACKSFSRLNFRNSFPSCAIVELDVADNKFSTRGGQAIGQLIKDNRSITDMDVSYNCMRPPACAAVLQVS